MMLRQFRAAISAKEALVVIWFMAAIVVYLTHTLLSVLHLAPHALYADQWRQYVAYLQQPFPLNVIAQDNSHRLILPNLVAVLELRWFNGNQWLQLAVGAVCATTAAALTACVCWRDRNVASTQRAAAAFLCVFSVFWLGNVRTLFHSAELLHTSIPICLMTCALVCVVGMDGTRHEVRRAALAVLFGAAAAFSFGYGIAVFPAVIAIAVVRRSDASIVTVLVGGGILTMLIFMLLPGGGGVSGVVGLSPLENLLVAMRWLGAPFVAMFVYLWDPNARWLLPNETLVSLAFKSSAHMPDLHVSVLPQALFGGLGIASLLWATLRSWQRPSSGPMRLLGIGLAWFGLGAAGIVCVSRLRYFDVHPEQIYADRYMPWPCLFWLGLGLVGLSTAASRKGRAALSSKLIVAFGIALPLVAWPTQKGGVIWASLTRSHIDNTAAGTMVGVIERNKDLGETLSDELVAGLPAIRAAHAAQFQWPEFALLGKTAAESLRPVDAAAITARPIDDNLLGPPGTAIVVDLGNSQALPDRLLLADSGGTIVGVATRDFRLGETRYSGYAGGLHGSDELRVLQRAP